MGFGWKDLNPVHGIQDAIGEANKIGHKLFGGGPGHEDDGGTDWYIGYNSNKGLNGYVSTGQKYNYGNAGRSTTTAYKANAAGTANKIAQGGMTKDDILKYNTIHPNEIAGDNPANTTALNTNTAIRSK